MPQPVAETESMTIDISEEVADEINEFVENEEGKESEEIETIETAEVSFLPSSDWLTNQKSGTNKEFSSFMFLMRMPNEIILMSHRISK